MAHKDRVHFKDAPGHVLNQAYGNLKWRKQILKAVKNFDSHASERELFRFLNTDDADKWIEVIPEAGPHAGKKTVPVPMATLRANIAGMITIGDLKRVGERSGLVALPSYEPSDEEEADAVDNGDEGEAEDE